MSSGIHSVIQLPSDMRHEDMYNVSRYSHSHSITFRHERSRHVWCLQVLSLPFDYLPTRETRTSMMSSSILSAIQLPSDMRNEDMDDVLKNYHCHSITFRREKGGHVWCLQVLSIRFHYLPTWETRTYIMFSGSLTSIRSPSNVRNVDMYNVFRYSHFDLITFQHEKPGHVWCLQVFSPRLDYLPTWETRTCIISSGILTSIQLPSNKWKRLCCYPVFLSLFDYASTYHLARNLIL